MTREQREQIAILDFGSQYTQLIARRVRESGVYCEIFPSTKVSVDFIYKLKPLGIILSGGPASVLEKISPKIPVDIYDLEIPILGICYGQQVMISQLGGKINRSKDAAEFGRAYVQKTEKNIDFLSHKGIYAPIILKRKTLVLSKDALNQLEEKYK